MTDIQRWSIIHALRQEKKQQLWLLALETVWRLGGGGIRPIQPYKGNRCSDAGMVLYLFLVSLALQLKQGTAQHPNTPGPHPRSVSVIAGDGRTPEQWQYISRFIRDVWVRLISYFSSIYLQPRDRGFQKTSFSSWVRTLSTLSGHLTARHYHFNHFTVPPPRETRWQAQFQRG